MKRNKEEQEEKEKEKKRARTDKFSDKSNKEISDRVDKIIQGSDNLYVLDKNSKANTDINGISRPCWQMNNKRGDQAKLYGVNSYKGFLLHYLMNNKQDLSEYNNIGKKDQQIAHKCGNNNCCNPDHLVIIDQKTNEEHKHYHYFLHHSDQNVRKDFISGDAIKNLINKLDLF